MSLTKNLNTMILSQNSSIKTPLKHRQTANAKSNARNASCHGLESKDLWGIGELTPRQIWPALTIHMNMKNVACMAVFSPALQYKPYLRLYPF